MKNEIQNRERGEEMDRMVEDSRIQEIVVRIARSQMRDRIRNQEIGELVNEAWMGVLEARERLEERGLPMTEGLVWRVAKFQILRWKMRMRSALTIPEGSAAKEAKKGNLELGMEMKDFLGGSEVGSPARLRETEIKTLLRIVRKQVDEKLGWVERKVEAALMDGGSPSEVWRELEEIGVRGAKEKAFGAKAQIKAEWSKVLGI